MLETWELQAREAIRDLVARYNANGDSGRFADVLALFADDGVLELVDEDGRSEVRRGAEEIRSVFTGASQQWAGDAAAQGTPHYVRHSVTTHQIDLVDEGHATGRSYFSVLLPHGLDHWGRYLDRYECRRDRWVFAHRRVLMDGRAPGR